MRKTGVSGQRQPGGSEKSAGRDRTDRCVRVNAIRETVKPGLVCLRVITDLNDIAWACGSPRGLKPIERELRDIVAATNGKWIE